MAGLLDQEDMDDVYKYVCIVSEAVSSKIPKKIFQGDCKQAKVYNLENFLTSEEGKHLFHPGDYNCIAYKAGLSHPLHSGAMLKTILHEKHVHVLFRRLIIEHLIEPFYNADQMRVFHRAIKDVSRMK